MRKLKETHPVVWGANITTWPDGNQTIISKILKQAQGQFPEIWEVSTGDPRVSLLSHITCFSPNSEAN